MNFRDQLQRARHSIWHPLARDPRPPGGSVYARMFVEDVVNMVLPFTAHSGEREIVGLESRDEKAESIIARAFGEARGHSGELTSAVRDFYREVLQRYFFEGVDLYEIVFYSEEEEEGKVDSFALLPITPGKISRRGNRVIQEVAGDSEHSAGRAEIPADVVVSFEIPELKQYAEAYRALQGVRDERPDFAFDALERWPRIGFDWRVYMTTERLTVAQITKAVGWNGRDLMTKDLTEYYVIERALRFAASLARARERILKSMNDAIERAGTVLGVASRLVLREIRTSAEIEHATKSLREGKLPFDKVAAIMW